MHADQRLIRRLVLPRAVAAAVAAVAVALIVPAAGAAAAPTVLLNETFSAQTTPPNFGFPAGADVSNGVLNVTKGMSHYSTSVKAFDAEIAEKANGRSDVRLENGRLHQREQDRRRVA